MKKSLFFLLFSILLIISFFNLGKFLDITSKPIKTDLLVCLGGGNYKTRIEKTLELYNNKYSKSNTIILTGYVNSKREVQKGIIEDKRISVIKRRDIKNLKYVIKKDLKNTAEEVKYIKYYMIKNKIKTVTFISDPPHSRRILFLTKLIRIDGDENFDYHVSGAYLKNWDKDLYYENKFSRIYSFTELFKLIYVVFTYGFLDKFGLLETFELTFEQEIKKLKMAIHKI